MDLYRKRRTFFNQSFLGLSYWQNFNGQSVDTTITKNILNIGEQHYLPTEKFKRFLEFLKEMITKNKIVKGCLDVMIEMDYKFKNKTPITQTKSIQDEEFNMEKSFQTLEVLRDFCMENEGLIGTRFHFTDTRFTYKKTISSEIIWYVNEFLNIFYMNLKKKSDYEELRIPETIDLKLFRDIIFFIYDYSPIGYDQKEGRRNVWLLFENVENFEKIYDEFYNNKYKELQTLNLSKGDKNYFKRFYTKNPKTVNFHNMIKEIIYKHRSLKKDLGELTIDLIYDNYLLFKDEEEKMNVKKLDSKIRKQFNNLDSSYFESEPKNIIMTYFVYIQKIMQNEDISDVFYDINTVCRMFRIFDKEKKRFPSCDNNNSNKNILIYSGDWHRKNIDNFLYFLSMFQKKPTRCGSSVEQTNKVNDIDFFNFNERIKKKPRQPNMIHYKAPQQPNTIQQEAPPQDLFSKINRFMRNIWTIQYDFQQRQENQNEYQQSQTKERGRFYFPRILIKNENNANMYELVWDMFDNCITDYDIDTDIKLYQSNKIEFENSLRDRYSDETIQNIIKYFIYNKILFDFINERIDVSSSLRKLYQLQDVINQYNLLLDETYIRKNIYYRTFDDINIDTLNKDLGDQIKKIFVRNSEFFENYYRSLIPRFYKIVHNTKPTRRSERMKSLRYTPY
jgi:hypothetical protein